MTRNIKITVLWLLTFSGFASHTIADVLPMFWGKDVAIASDGIADQGMIILMVTLSFLIPACGILTVMSHMKNKAPKILNLALAIIIAFFNLAHAFIELPSDNAGQYIIMPMMIAIGLMLAWQSLKYVKDR